MKKLLSAFLSIGVLIIAQVNSFSQEQDSLIQLYLGIGDTLNSFDRNYFKFYPKIEGFEFAVYYTRDNEFLVSKVSYIENGIRADTSFVLPLSALSRMRSRMEQLDIENRKKVESPREAFITLKNGEKYKGELKMFSKDYLYLFAEDNWVYSTKNKRYKIKIADVDSIIILGESKALSSMGWGALFGLVLGGVIGFASGSDSKGFVRFSAEEKALGLGGFFGFIGGIVGLIAGLVSSTDDEFIQYSSQEELIRLNDYAEYYFIYDEVIENSYAEIK